MAAPKQDIPLKKLIDEASDEASSLSRDTAKITRNLRSSGRDIRDVGGLLDLLTGRVNIGNIRDVGGVAEMAAERLAKQGNDKAALQLMGVAGAARFAAAAAGTAFLFAGTAKLGYELGSMISKKLPGSAEDISAGTKAASSYQQMVFDSNMGVKQTAEFMGRGRYRPESGLSKLAWAFNPIERLEDWSDFISGTSGASRETWEEDPYAKIDFFVKKNRISHAAYMKAVKRERAEQSWYTDLFEFSKKAENDRIEKILAENLKAREDKDKYMIEHLNKSAVGLRTRALENLRSQSLRKQQERQWSGVKDWSL
jgi:hypothetical protein